MQTITLQPGRGTKLYKNNDQILNVEFISKDGKNIGKQIQNSLMIIGNLLGKIGHLGIASQNGYKVKIKPDDQYMIINNSPKELNFKFDNDISDHEVIYDPYLYEDEDHSTVDPEVFKKDHPVPDGYIDILPKWYSIKFTYPDENYIFIRPGLGISLQTHKQREEHWEVVRGNPIIISGSQIFYNTQSGDKFDIPLGDLHTVINDSKDEWILIKEKYSGHFDEEDIERVFNPNHYVSK